MARLKPDIEKKKFTSIFVSSDKEVVFNQSFNELRAIPGNAKLKKMTFFESLISFGLKYIESGGTIDGIVTIDNEKKKAILKFDKL